MDRVFIRAAHDHAVHAIVALSLAALSMFTSACASAPAALQATATGAPLSIINTATSAVTNNALSTSISTTAAAIPVTVKPPATSAPVPPTSQAKLPAAATSILTVPAPVIATVIATRAATLEPAAAIVNGTIRISLSVLDKTVNSQLDALHSVGSPLPADVKAYRNTVLDSLIQQALIEQEAAKRGITVTDQDVEAEVQSYIQLAGSRDKWLASIAADRMTEAEYRAGLRSALITGKMRDVITSSVGQTAEQVHARHILVLDEASANQILQQLKSGANFADLAAKLSLDVTTRQTGGDLGWFPRGQLLQKSIEDAAFSLPLNQYSAPVKSDLGYHIVETLERVKDRPIDAETRANLARQTFEAWLQSLVQTAHIEKYPPA